MYMYHAMEVSYCPDICISFEIYASGMGMMFEIQALHSIGSPAEPGLPYRDRTGASPD